MIIEPSCKRPPDVIDYYSRCDRMRWTGKARRQCSSVPRPTSRGKVVRRNAEADSRLRKPALIWTTRRPGLRQVCSAAPL